MPKVYFFKLAKELGENPVELQKRLATQGIAVKTTSTMLDEDVAAKIREFSRQTAAAAAQAPAAEPQPTPVATPSEEAPAAPPQPAPQVSATPAAPPTPSAPAPAAPVSGEQQPTHVVKRAVDGEGRPLVQRAQPTQPAGTQPTPAAGTQPAPAAGAPAKQPRKIRHNLLITPEVEGGLSPEAEFGIVKAAGTVPLPQTRPSRPPQQQREGGPRPPQREGGPRPPRPEGGPGGRPMPAAPSAPDMGDKGAGKTAARGPVDKKKQKRTVFTEKEKTRLQNRRSEAAPTTLRSRRKRRDKVRADAGEMLMDEPIIITAAITVGELAERAHVAPAQVITQLIGMGVLATINQQIEPEQAVSVLEKLGLEALYESEMLEQASWRLTAGNGEAVTVGEPRPPVVTILGHVDHGKTTLLDSIRKTNVTAQEFGGITQHIGAYQVEIDGHKISFLDTPGHAAFTAMRARGANLTDIAVLVVAADDGIQPQTIEAIDHAKAAHVPIIVAINKIDLPDAQPDVVKQQLTAHGLVSEEWGGDTIMVPLSAKQGLHIDKLLEMILLVAEVQELRAVAEGSARGAVVESELDKQLGPVATVLVQEGTLHVGDALVVGMVPGKIRVMTDYKGRRLKEATPSTPVVITGLAEVPVAGDLFEVVESERKAREIAEARQLKAREERLQAHVSLQDLSNMVASGQVQDLNIIMKSDVAGSIEAISHALSQIEHAEIRVNIIHAGVGDVTESDVLLASASQAIIVGFHVRIEPQARMIAEETGIDVRLYQVIYDLIDDVKKAMTGMLTPIFEEVILGHAEVKAVFKLSRTGTIAGCFVTDGKIRRSSKVRVRRDGEVVHTGTLDSLKHLKEDQREMAQGFECGIGIDNFSGWKEGDIVESFVMQELRRESIV